MTDTSNIFHAADLDPEYAVLFDPTKPWVLEWDGPDGEEMQRAFATEDEACAAQRRHRLSIGRHPMTGEPVNDKTTKTCGALRHWDTQAESRPLWQAEVEINDTRILVMIESPEGLKREVLIEICSNSKGEEDMAVRLYEGDTEFPVHTYFTTDNIEIDRREYDQSKA